MIHCRPLKAAGQKATITNTRSCGGITTTAREGKNHPEPDEDKEEEDEEKERKGEKVNACKA